MKKTGRDRWANGFYWLGVSMTVGSVALVLLGNTTWGAVVEHTSFPLGWKFAGVAVVAFLAGEICRPAFPFHHEKEDPESRPDLDRIPYEI